MHLIHLAGKALTRLVALDDAVDLTTNDKADGKGERSKCSDSLARQRAAGSTCQRPGLQFSRRSARMSVHGTKRREYPEK